MNCNLQLDLQVSLDALHEIVMSKERIYLGRNSTLISSLVPKHCRHGREAETLSLKPPNAQLAGLSADTTQRVP